MNHDPSIVNTLAIASFDTEYVTGTALHASIAAVNTLISYPTCNLTLPNSQGHSAIKMLRNEIRKHITEDGEDDCHILINFEILDVLVDKMEDSLRHVHNEKDNSTQPGCSRYMFLLLFYS